jgi:hypothetical protein
MQIKLQKLDQDWQAEAAVNGQIYQWACWGLQPDGGARSSDESIRRGGPPRCGRSRRRRDTPRRDYRNSAAKRVR